MKTAEVAIEHILTGLLALCAFVLPFLNVGMVGKDLLSSEKVIGVLGVAYLFGVIFDKLADTLLSPLEQWLRLKEAARYVQSGKPCYGNDPFPQDVLEYRLRKAKDGRLEWMDSLRSRLRTARGLAVLGFPAAIGLMVYLSWSPSMELQSAKGLPEWFYLHIIFNLLCVVVVVLISSRNVYRLPRTSELPRGQEEKDKVAREEFMVNAKRGVWIGMSWYLLLFLNSFIALNAISSESTEQPSLLALLGLGGAILSLLALWTWHTITRTYISFVHCALPELLNEVEKTS